MPEWLLTILALTALLWTGVAVLAASEGINFLEVTAKACWGALSRALWAVSGAFRGWGGADYRRTQVRAPRGPQWCACTGAPVPVHVDWQEQPVAWLCPDCTEQVPSGNRVPPFSPNPRLLTPPPGPGGGSPRPSPGPAGVTMAEASARISLALRQAACTHPDTVPTRTLDGAITFLGCPDCGARTPLLPRVSATYHEAGAEKNLTEP